MVRLPIYVSWLRRQLATFQPDLIIGASDIPHVVMANWLSRALKVPYAVDLYDNFESFGQARIPGFRPGLAHAARCASLVITVGARLRDKVLADYGCQEGDVLVMPNGVDPSVFAPGPRGMARRLLGLPEDAQLIGTAGGLSRLKGLGIVYAAWQKIKNINPNIHLVLAGPIERGFSPPSDARVHYLGELPEHLVAELFRALDVGIVSLTDSDFGQYCFPQKANEMLACRLPVVVSDVGEMPTHFASTPNILYPHNDADALVRVIFAQLTNPTEIGDVAPSWRTLVGKMEPRLRAITHRN